MQPVLLRRTITDLVETNYVYAHVLYHFGIRFYEHADDTLAHVCRQRGLNATQVVQGLENARRPPHTPEDVLRGLPIELVVEYLRHAHGVFVKQTLPYMAHLVEQLHTDAAACVRDLQLLFPLFVEDFIVHIHEEEDTFFQYVHLLQRVRQGKVPAGRIFFELEKHSVQHFALDHETHDDEMTGIRDITGQYTLPPGCGPHLMVVFAELKAFEEDLILHARVENEILFPKALALEKEVQDALRQTARWN